MEIGPLPKKYFVKRNTPHNTRQAGQLEYCRTRIELGISRVQYHAAKLWNLLNHRYKSIPCIYEFKNTLSENIITGYIDWVVFYIRICNWLTNYRRLVSNKTSIWVIKYLAYSSVICFELVVLPALISKHVLLLWWPPTGMRMNGYCCCITLYMHNFGFVGNKISINITNRIRFIFPLNES